jgi:hypothetical protein
LRQILFVKTASNKFFYTACDDLLESYDFQFTMVDNLLKFTITIIFIKFIIVIPDT